MKTFRAVILVLVSVPASVGTLFAADILLPAIEPGDKIVAHQAYTLSYSEKHEQAEWVAYTLTRPKLFGTQKRTNNFRSDPQVPTGSATLQDYAKSGYDRGHLAPAADMKFSKAVMSESFYMSNMSPQRPWFNRGIWRDLESVIRRMAYGNEVVNVVTGPVLNRDDFPTIGPGRVSVPDFYYKVVLDSLEPELKAIGFVLPNRKSDEPLENFVVPVDDVERLTGIDFFEALPDYLEQSLESTVDTSLWTFKPFLASRFKL